MTAKTDPAKIDHGISLYATGKTLREAAAEAGVSVSPLRRALHANGIEPRTNRLSVPADAIVAAYTSGEAEATIAARFGIDRGVVRRRLVEAAVPIRGISGANRLRMARMTPAERSQLTSAAHTAARGSIRSEASVNGAALTRQHRMSHVSEAENQLAEWLRDLGELPIQQKAVGRYNVDLALHPVAVEVLGGGWHTRATRHTKRTPYLFNQGWHLLFIWDDRRRCPLAPAAAEYAVAFLQEARSDPSGVRQYRVIRGDGQEVARGTADADDLALVPSPGRVRDSRRAD